MNIGAVILAAGASTRFGSPKQLLVHEGEPLIRRAAMSAKRAALDPIVIVVGSDSEAVARALAELDDVKITVNPNWKSGLASSLSAGLKFLRDQSECDGALVLLADQPLVDATALSRLVTAFDQSHRIIASEYERTVGVPAIFGREHFDGLMELEGDVGAGPWLRARADVTRVPLTAGAVDIDTPADAMKLNLTAH